MPDLTTLMIAGGAWMLLFVLVWALCAAAGRADGQSDAERSAVQPRFVPATRPAVVADTGGIRAHLRAATGLIRADQLTVIAEVEGTQAVLASAPPVLPAGAGERAELSTPIRVGGRIVASLRAIGPPGGPPFDATDRLLLQALAARVAGSMQAAQPARPTTIGDANVMA